MAADVELMQLRADEHQLNEQLQVREGGGRAMLDSRSLLWPIYDIWIGPCPAWHLRYPLLLQDPEQALKDDPSFDAEEAQGRLNEVYDRMGIIAGSTAESRASKILHGLGFSEKMQKRSTQSFRCHAGQGACVGRRCCISTMQSFSCYAA